MIGPVRRARERLESWQPTVSLLTNLALPAAVVGGALTGSDPDQVVWASGAAATGGLLLGLADGVVHNLPAHFRGEIGRTGTALSMASKALLMGAGLGIVPILVGLLFTS